MEEKTGNDSNRIPLSLAALMFFSPFIQYFLNKKSIPLSDQDRDFVSGYVKLGYLNLILAIIAIGTGVGNYLVKLPLLQVVYAISMGILLLFLLAGTIGILSDVSLHLQKNLTLSYYDIGEKRKGIILKYLPRYNIYLRYTLHSFGTPNRWIKESLLRWTIFFLLMLTGNPYILSLYLVILILRIATLAAGVDFLSLKIKQATNQLFVKNPEEIWGYMTGLFAFLGQAIASIFHTPTTPLSLSTKIREEKTAYSLLYNTKDTPKIWSEYIIGILLGVGYRYFLRPDLSSRTVSLPLALLVGRYLLMIIVWKHLPNLPIAREVRLLLTLLFVQPFRFLFLRHRHDATQ